MKHSITARHFELTEAIQNYIHQKLDSLNEYTKDIIEANFVLEIEKNSKIIDNQIVEIHLHAPKISSEKINCKVATPDLYKSIDEAIYKIHKIIQKEKEKTLHI